MKPYKQVDPDDAHRIQLEREEEGEDERELKAPPRSSAWSRVADWGPCRCVREGAWRLISCAVVGLAVVVVLIGVIVYLARQSTTGSTIVDQVQQAVVGSVLSTLGGDSLMQRSLYRHRFSTLDSGWALPRNSPMVPYYDASLSPWAGWVDLQPTFIRYNVTTASQAHRFFLAVWYSISSPSRAPDLVAIPASSLVCASAANDCRLVIDAWSMELDTVICAVITTATAPATSDPHPRWDQVVDHIVALARVL